MDDLEITTLENLTFIDSQLDEAHSPSADDIEGIVGYGMSLAAIISLCGKTLADSKKLLNIKELEYMNNNRNLWEKPTILKKLMEGELAVYYSRVIWADRLIAACTHKMDFYRSVISKHKEELRLQIVQFSQQIHG